MQILLLFAFIFGTIVGSFLNVLILRYGTKTLSGRSSCMSCSKRLHWYELMPVLSFLWQQGRCRGCKTRLSWQYPTVELLTGLIFAAVIWKNLQPTTYNLPPEFSFLPLLVVGSELLVWSLLIAIAVYDTRHKIIPDALVYGAVAVSLIYFAISYFIYRTSSLLDLSGTLLLSLPFALLWYFSRGRAMGLGDAKLLALFSPYLGFAPGLSALLIGFWLGALLSIGALLLKGAVSVSPRRLTGLKRTLKGLTMKSELPLAPFLIAGLFIVYLFGIDVTGLGMLLE